MMKTLHLAITAIVILMIANVTAVFGQDQNTKQIVHITIPSGALSPHCGPMCFIPEDVTVARGTVVDWVNKDLVPHNSSSGQASDNQTGTVFDSGLIQPGHDFEHKFDKAGTYKYFDHVHPWNTGVVRVSDTIFSNKIPDVITARTDRDSYHGGDTITITGTTNVYIQNPDVVITVIDPAKNVILTSNASLQQDNNSYLTTIIADKKFAKSGTYEIEAKYGDAQYQTYFDFSPTSPTQKIIQVAGVGNDLNIELVQGQSTQLAVNFDLNKGYGMESVELSLTGMPQGVQAWINPQQLYTAINSNYTQGAQIPIYVDSGAAPGNYSINIVGNGNILNKTSNNDIPFNYQRMASINLTIKPSANPISVDIGQPAYASAQFCTDTETTGHMCESFVGSEEFPVAVYSKTPTTVKLDAQVPAGGYLKFIPDTLEAESNGSRSKMVIAGIMEPFIINPLDTYPMEIKATSSDGSNAVAYLPIIHFENVTVLKSAAPIQPVSKDLLSSGSQTAIIPFGVVYEPQADSSAALPVRLEALGLVNGTNIVPFTPSFSVKIPQDSFVLNASSPYHFMVEAISHSLPSRSITFALGEHVGSQRFVQNVTLSISNVRFGGLGGSQIMVSPPSSQQNDATNPMFTTVWIGGIVGTGAGTISFFVLRRKPN